MSEKQNDNRENPQSGDATERALQEELRREAEEGRDDVGDLGKNRNLSGSSTWDTQKDEPAA